MDKIEITAEILERAARKPYVNHNPLPEYSYTNLDYGMTIGIERTDGGRMFSCWVGGGDSPLAFFVLAYSDDGENWGDPCLVIDPHDKTFPFAISTIVGNLWLDPLGRLWLFFNQSLEHYDGCSTNWYICCDKPDADTLIWSDPVYIWHGETLNKPIVLSNGDWLLPVSLWARYHISAPFKDCYRELDELRGANVLISSDNGETWNRRGCVKFPSSHFDEHMIIEKNNNSLWMLARTANGIWESFSFDSGYTWREPQFSEIAHISARFNIRRLKSGKLLLVKHGKTIDTLTPNRCDLTAYLSDDDGKTWQGGLVLDERAEVSYPDSIQTADGKIYIQYDYNRATAGHILYVGIYEEDIMAGHIVNENSFVKKLISKPLGLK